MYCILYVVCRLINQYFCVKDFCWCFALGIIITSLGLCQSNGSHPSIGNQWILMASSFMPRNVLFSSLVCWLVGGGLSTNHPNIFEACEQFCCCGVCLSVVRSFLLCCLFYTLTKIIAETKKEMKQTVAQRIGHYRKIL